MKLVKPVSAFKLPVHPPGVKLANAPIDYLILLYAVTLNAQGKDTLKSADISAHTGISVIKVNRALTALTTQKLIVPTQVISLSEFKFKLPAEVMQALRQHARSYKEHLRAKATRAAERRAHDAIKQAATAKLPPLPSALIETYTASAAAQATRLQLAHLGHKFAICMARIGEEAVIKLVDHVIATHTTKSLRYHFFAVYTKHCQTLFAPPSVPVLSVTLP